MSTPDKCPKCGADQVLCDVQSYRENGGLFNPEHMEHDKVRDLIMRLRDLAASERTAHAETRQQYMELIMAVARKFDGETRHQTALRYIKHAEDVAREAGKADAAMNRLDAEAKEGK